MQNPPCLNHKQFKHGGILSFKHDYCKLVCFAALRADCFAGIKLFAAIAAE